MERTRGSAGDGSTAGRTDLSQFQAFYDFALARVYRFAFSRMGNESRAEALTELILVSALTSIGGVHAPDNGLRGDPAELAFKLFAIAQRVADRVDEDPTLLETPHQPVGRPAGSDFAAVAARLKRGTKLRSVPARRISSRRSAPARHPRFD